MTPVRPVWYNVGRMGETTHNIKVSLADILDLERAIKAIDRIEARHPDDWDDESFDQVSRARAEIVEWLGKNE